MNFSKKIKRALEHENGLVFEQESLIENNQNIKISTGMLNLRDNQEEEYIDLLKAPKTNSQEYYPYFNFIVFESDKKVCSFTIYGLIQLSKISFLVEDGQIAFYNIEDTVYMDCCNLKNVNEIRKMFSSVKLLSKDWNIDLYSILGNKRKEILFFDGKKFLSIIPRKIIFFEDKLPEYFRHTNLRKVSSMCKVCGMNKYDFIIDENPIIPVKYRRVCRDCLNVIKQNAL